MSVLTAPPKDISLKGLVLIELDKNNDVNIVWNHPPLGEEFDKLALHKADITKFDVTQNEATTYSKYKDKWVYIITVNGEGISSYLVAFSICLFTDTFNPEKYLALLRLMTKLYQTKKIATDLLDCYLNVYTRATFGSPEGNFSSLEYDTKRDHLLASSLITVIKDFEDSSWQLWSALLMKKRVAVYGPNLEALLTFVRALPLFVLHRQDWNLLRPNVDIKNPLEIEDLERTGVYIAGSTSPQIKQKEDLYDLFVDLSSQSVTVADHAKDDFIQTKFHQEFSSFLTTAVVSEGFTDQKLIGVIKKKTGDLIGRLNTIKKDGPVTFSLLAEQNLPPHMDAFLYSVASAEGMTKV